MFFLLGGKDIQCKINSHFIYPSKQKLILNERMEIEIQADL